jgi:acyl carrier protein
MEAEQQSAGKVAGQGGPVTVELAREALARVLERKGRTAELGPNTNLRSLDLDSLDIGELFVTLEELSGRELDPESAEGVEVLGDLVRVRALG